jgi:hypothetical protein
MPIAPGTIALYEFENNGLDSSGNGYDLVEVGTVPFQAGGPAGGAYQAGPFTDTDYFNTPAGFNAALSGLSVWTWEFYVTPNSVANSPIVLLSVDDGLAFFEILPPPFEGAGKFHRLFARPVLAQSADGEFVVGNTYHVAVVCDGSSVSVYKALYSGGELGPHSLIASAASGATFGTVTDSFVGRSSLAFPTFALDGYVDEMRISNVARTSFPTVDPDNIGSIVLDRRRRGE